MDQESDISGRVTNEEVNKDFIDIAKDGMKACSKTEGKTSRK